MRLLCWNIHKGIGGVDRRYDLHRILRVIDHYDPDVVVLQEVDRGVPRSRRQDQTSLISEVLSPELYQVRNPVGLKILHRPPLPGYSLGAIIFFNRSGIDTNAYIPACCFVKEVWIAKQ